MTLTSTDGPANGGGTFATNFATGLGTNDVPGITDPTVVAEAAALDWNPGAAGTATIDFGGGVVQDPIVLINFTDVQVLTFDFADALTVVVLDANPPGSVTIAPGNVVTTAGGNANGANDGFAVQLLGSFTSITFATNVNLDTTINSVGITVGARSATFAPSFAPQATFATGTDPRNVVIADFNGDFRPDLAVDNTGADNNLGVLLNSPPVVIADGTAVGTILDDDPPPTVSLSLAGSPLAEAGGVATVTATLSAASSFDVTVTLGFSGTATNAADYTRSGTSIVIPAGSTTGSITLTGVDDTLDEADETVVVDITGVTNGTENGDAAGHGDDHRRRPAADGEPEPGRQPAGRGRRRRHRHRHALGRLGPGRDGHPGFSGTATNVADYTRSGTSIIIPAGSTTGSITLTGVDDALDEADETVVVDITGVTNGTENGEQQVTATITDDDAAADGARSTTSPSPRRPAPPPSPSRSTAASGQIVIVSALDRRRHGDGAGRLRRRRAPSIFIPAGVTSQTFTVTGRRRRARRGRRDVRRQHHRRDQRHESPTPQGIGTITDDDPPPTVSLSLAGSPLAEAGGVATVTATLSAASGLDVTVTLGFSGTATVVADYTRSGTSDRHPGRQHHRQRHPHRRRRRAGRGGRDGRRRHHGRDQRHRGRRRSRSRPRSPTTTRRRR